MMRSVLLALLLPVAVLGQIQVFTFDGNSEKPLTAITDLGSVPTGDLREIRFRVRNVGSGSAAVTAAVSGVGFELYGAPLMPVPIAPNNFREFRVRFSALPPGSYSGMFTAGNTQTLLRATVVTSATVSVVDNMAGYLLSGGATLQFGRVRRGQSATRELRIANGSAAPLLVDRCATSGEAFSLSGISCPFTLPPSSSRTAIVTFDARAAVDYTGTLSIGGRQFGLAGSGYEPPLPRPAVNLNGPVSSGVQRKLSIALATAAETSGSGTVTLELRRAEPNFPDDPAVGFTSSGRRSLDFTVKEGDHTAAFAFGSEATFQTGTTAGTLVFTVKLGEHSEEFTYPIGPAPAAVDTAVLSRRPGMIDVAVTAFDNTRTAGRFAFTFYDTSGRVIQPGAVRADWSESFFNYFRKSTAGGTFAMRASFPISGDASFIGSVEVEITNASGTTRTERISMSGVLP
jgi:hypothetical protein